MHITYHNNDLSILMSGDDFQETVSRQMVTVKAADCEGIQDGHSITLLGGRTTNNGGSGWKKIFTVESVHPIRTPKGSFLSIFFS